MSSSVARVVAIPLLILAAGVAAARPNIGPDDEGRRKPEPVRKPVSPAPAPKAKAYQLKPESIDKLAELQQLIRDGEQSIRVADALLAAVPFLPLLGKPDPLTPLEIADTDWGLIAQAAGGLRAELRTQVRDFCILQAARIPADSGFWSRLADQLHAQRKPNAAETPVPVRKPAPGEEIDREHFHPKPGPKGDGSESPATEKREPPTKPSATKQTPPASGEKKPAAKPDRRPEIDPTRKPLG